MKKFSREVTADKFPGSDPILVKGLNSIHKGVNASMLVMCLFAWLDIAAYSMSARIVALWGGEIWSYMLTGFSAAAVLGAAAFAYFSLKRRELFKKTGITAGMFVDEMEKMRPEYVIKGDTVKALPLGLSRGLRRWLQLMFIINSVTIAFSAIQGMYLSFFLCFGNIYGIYELFKKKKYGLYILCGVSAATGVYNIASNVGLIATLSGFFGLFVTVLLIKDQWYRLN